MSRFVCGYGFQGHNSVRLYKGITLASNPGQAKLDTFADTLATLSDSLKFQVSIKETFNSSIDEANLGTEKVKHVGWCLIREVDGLSKWPVAVPGISEENILSQKGGDTLTDPAIAVILGAAATLMSVDPNTLEAVGSWINHEE